MTLTWSWHLGLRNLDWGKKWSKSVSTCHGFSYNRNEHGIKMYKTRWNYSCWKNKTYKTILKQIKNHINWQTFGTSFQTQLPVLSTDHRSKLLTRSNPPPVPWPQSKGDSRGRDPWRSCSWDINTLGQNSSVLLGILGLFHHISPKMLKFNEWMDISANIFLPFLGIKPPKWIIMVTFMGYEWDIWDIKK